MNLTNFLRERRHHLLLLLIRLHTVRHSKNLLLRSLFLILLGFRDLIPEFYYSCDVLRFLLLELDCCVTEFVDELALGDFLSMEVLKLRTKNEISMSE